MMRFDMTGLLLCVVIGGFVPAAQAGSGAPSPLTTAGEGTSIPSGKAGGGAYRRETLRNETLPDTVLARIGHDRSITVSRFLEERRRAGRSVLPDSLTPQETRRFLERLADREVLVEAAMAEPRIWTSDDSARFGRLRDHLILQTALDSALAAWNAAGAQRDTAGLAGPDHAGAALRDHSVGRLQPSFDDALLERLAEAWRALPRPTADSSLAAQLRMLEALPRLPEDVDSLAVIARSSLGPYRVKDLLDSWSHLSPAYRPRIETPSEIAELVRNGLFERLLRAEAEGRNLERRPDIARKLETEKERIALEHYLERRVLHELRGDSLGARRWFEAHSEEWAVPMRVRLLRLAFDERPGAERMALALRDPVQAESLASRSTRLGLDYVIEVSASSDSALFRPAREAVPGTVIGPTPLGDGWQIARLLAVLPGRPARYEEVRRRVEPQWWAEEGERRVEALCAALRRTIPVTVNDRGLERLRPWISGRPVVDD